MFAIKDGLDIRFRIRYPAKSGHFSAIRYAAGYRILIKHFYFCLEIWDVEQRTGIAPRSYFVIYFIQIEAYILKSAEDPPLCHVSCHFVRKLWLTQCYNYQHSKYFEQAILLEILLKSQKESHDDLMFFEKQRISITYFVTHTPFF